MFRKLFPRLLVVAFASALTATAVAQTTNPDDRPRYAVHNTASVTPKPREIADDSADTKETTAKLANAVALEQRFHDQLLIALESPVCPTYHFNRPGPET